MKYDLLNTINTPENLRQLKTSQLKQLARELRAFVLESVSSTGGHLSSNLGTVELTIALHYVFNTPEDRIVWDVGHQSYPHKILTGRREAMATLRQWEGISGFPRRAESIYDTFGTAHSSTSISAALGMALAAKNQGQARHCIAVIGDGAMTAGMAFEAMNNAGVYNDLPLIVILNDNDMSISPPVGALHRYLTRLMSGKFYAKAKKSMQKIFRVMPPAPEPVQGLPGGFAPPQTVQLSTARRRKGTGEALSRFLEIASKIERNAKGMLMPATLFEELGFNYLGPIDGHDLNALIPTLCNLKQLQGPQFLHVVTRKGQGYKPAEADPVLYHGPGKFNPQEGIKPSKSNLPTYTQVFGDWLCDMAAQDERVVGITPAMREGSGLVAFEQRFPNRYYDVGIAEQHAVTFAGGLAAEGMKPVVAIYSTFLQRAYDQLIHDIALQNLPVVFALDRAGLVGADGATHAGAYDLAYLRCIPNMVVMAPTDENECRQMLYTAFMHNGPAAVRYPRGAGVGVEIQQAMKALPLGQGEIRRESSALSGQRVALLAFGSMLGPALTAAESLDATVANMRFVKPLDEVLLKNLAANHDYLVTIEEGCVSGGAGSACVEVLLAAAVPCQILQLGLPDRFIEHGESAQLLALCGLDAAGIIRSIEERFGLAAFKIVNSPKLAA